MENLQQQSELSVCNTFRAVLRAFLKNSERGTQKRIAKAANISPSQLSDIISGRRKGDEDTRRALAKALGYDYETFLGLCAQPTTELDNCDDLTADELDRLMAEINECSRKIRMAILRSPPERRDRKRRALKSFAEHLMQSIQLQERLTNLESWLDSLGTDIDPTGTGNGFMVNQLVIANAAVATWLLFAGLLRFADYAVELFM